MVQLNFELRLLRLGPTEVNASSERWYSFLSKVSDSVGLVALGFSSSSYAFVKGTEVHLLVQLEGKSIEGHLVDWLGNFRSSDHHLEGEALSKSVAMRATEAHVDLVLSSRGWEVSMDCEGDSQLEGLVASDSEGDINSDGLDRHVGLFVSVLGIIKSEEASLLPRPLSTVLDLNFSKGSLSRHDVHDLLVVLVNSLGAFVLPFTTALAFTHHTHELLAHSHHVFGLAFSSLVAHELLHHLSRVKSRLFALGFHVSTHLRVHKLVHHLHGVESLGLLFRLRLLSGLLFSLFLLLGTELGFHHLSELRVHEFLHHLSHHATALAFSHLLLPVFALLNPLRHLVELLLDLLNAHLVSSFLRQLVDLNSSDVLLLDELLE